MQHDITADWPALFRSATSTADDFLNSALRATSDLPEGVDRTAVIVAYMHVAASDWHTSAVNVAAQKVARVLDEACTLVREVGR